MTPQEEYEHRFDDSTDAATHAVIHEFEWLENLPEGDRLGELMVEINDTIAHIMRRYRK